MPTIAPWLLSIPLLVLTACRAHETSSSAPSSTRPPSAAPAARPYREPVTQDGCRACRGEWAAHGMLATLSCLCPTADAGKRCRDGAECEGQCLADDGAREVTVAGPPPRGYFVGACSRFRTNFGCHRSIAAGALKAGPVSLDDPPTEICAD